MANPTNLNQYPRALSDLEFGFYKKTFPKIDRASITVLGPKDPKYNCISYSLGFTDRWIDVGNTKQGLSELCRLYLPLYQGTLLMTPRCPLLLRGMFYSRRCH